MSFRLYQVRKDLKLRSIIQRKGPEYLVADPVSSKAFKVSYLQYMILRYFQAYRATTQDAITYLADRLDVEIEEETLSSFMNGIAARNLLEPDHHVNLSGRKLLRISAAIRPQIDRLIKQSIKDKTCTQEDQEFYALLRQDLHEGRIMDILTKSSTATGIAGQAFRSAVYEIARAEIISQLKSDQSGLVGDLPSTRVPILNPEKFLSYTKPVMSLLFSKAGLILLVVFFGYGFTCFSDLVIEFFRNWEKTYIEILRRPFSAYMIGNISAMWHELGHAILCSYFGGNVRSIGLLLFYHVIPGAYTDVSDINFMPKRRRIAVMLGGVFFQSILTCLSAIVWKFTPSGSPMKFYMFTLSFLNGTSLINNLLPVPFKLDGYYILSDILEIDNLYVRSSKYCKARLRRFILGSKLSKSEELLENRERSWFWIYFVSSKWMLLLQLSIGAYMMISQFDQLPLFSLFLVYVFLANSTFSMMSFAMKGVRRAKGIFVSWKIFGSVFDRQLMWRYGALTLLFLFLWIPVKDRIWAVARVQPDRFLTLYSQVNGEIAAVAGEEGAHVLSGGIVANVISDSLLFDLEKEKLRKKILEQKLTLATNRNSIGQLQLLRSNLSIVEVELSEAENSRRVFEISRALDLISEDDLSKIRNVSTYKEKEYAWSRATFEKDTFPTDRRILEQLREDIRISDSKIRDLVESQAKLDIFSPMDGRILSWFDRQPTGRQVQKGDAVVLLGSERNIVEAYLPQSEELNVEVGNQFRFSDISSGKSQLGELFYVGSNISNSNVTKNFGSGKTIPRDWITVRGKVSAPIKLPSQIDLSGRIVFEGRVVPLGLFLVRKVVRSVKYGYWGLS